MRRDWSGVAEEADGAGRLGVFEKLERREFAFLGARGALVLAVVEVSSWDADVFMGDLKGVLKGERKGLESVWEAASILLRLAAGVDIMGLH